jgi:nucleoside-diphosphate-sugar epimerase
MYADVPAAARELEFTPRVSLEEGLRRTVAAYRAVEEAHPADGRRGPR